LHKKGNAAIEPRRNTTRTCNNRLHVRRDLAFQRQAIILGMLAKMQDFRRTQQRLGRNAAPVEANTAQMFALDDSRLEAKLRGADRRDVTAGARSDNNN